MSQRTFEEALREVRSILAAAGTTDEQRRELAGLLSGIDRILRRRDDPPRAPDARAPEEAETEELRREVERLRHLATKDHGLLRAILQESPHGILVSDARGKLLVQNRAAERIWAGSATADDVEGWGKYRAFHPDGRPYAPSDWSMARCLSENRTVEAEEVHFQRFDGTHGILLGSCAPIRAADGTLLGAVSVFADMTHFKQVERLKDRWVGVAGHEIRSPLQVLKARIAMAQGALEAGRPVELAGLLRILEQQVNRLQTLVEDMLDVSRAQAGTLDVKVKASPLTPLVVRAAELIVNSAGAHRLSLEAEEVTALLDPSRLEQVITNLLNNSVRYSPAGGEIRVRVTRRHAEALVEVADAGIGFEPDEAQRLFEPFIQLSRGAGRSGGLGLGLYLSRELVQKMNGRIWAQSAGRGKGATFGFTLPLSNA
jgi:PAS domain S-box-containing protein